MLEFEWDLAKDLENIAKHGVSLIEAVETFYDPKGFEMVDVKHSTDRERRSYWIGATKPDRILTTRFTRRGTVIRIIRTAEWRQFRELYYERTQNQRPTDG